MDVATRAVSHEGHNHDPSLPPFDLVVWECVLLRLARMRTSLSWLIELIDDLSKCYRYGMFNMRVMA